MLVISVVRLPLICITVCTLMLMVYLCCVYLPIGLIIPRLTQTAFTAGFYSLLFNALVLCCRHCKADEGVFFQCSKAPVSDPVLISCLLIQIWALDPSWNSVKVMRKLGKLILDVGFWGSILRSQSGNHFNLIYLWSCLSRNPHFVSVTSFHHDFMVPLVTGICLIWMAVEIET